MKNMTTYRRAAFALLSAYLVVSGAVPLRADEASAVGLLEHMLRPGGLMYIGLYSEAARGPVVTVREMIAERGYGATADGIRRCRRDIMEAVRDGDREMEKLVIWADFYSLSGCRDLLFHVQEHRFTIPMIEDALEQLDLTFLGFELSGNRPARLVGAMSPPSSSRHASASTAAMVTARRPSGCRKFLSCCG